jgi:hypothetical protein
MHNKQVIKQLVLEKHIIEALLWDSREDDANNVECF